MIRDERLTLSEEGCNCSKIMREVPAGRNMLRVSSIQYFLEEVEDDLRVFFHYKFVEVVL
jgi:hypothetical protein